MGDSAARPFELTSLKRERIPPPKEHRLQSQVAMYLRLALPPDAFSTAIDHAHKADQRTGGILKGRGAVSGLPDQWIVWRSRLYCIELKRRGGYVTENQQICHGALRRAGAEVAICRSLPEVEAALKGWGLPLRALVAA